MTLTKRHWGCGGSILFPLQ